MKKYHVEVFSVYRETFEVEADSPAAAGLRLLGEGRDAGKYVTGDCVGILPEAGVEGIASITVNTGDGTADLLTGAAAQVREKVRKSFVTRYRRDEEATSDGCEIVDELEDEFNSRYGG